ncbi:MAG TPA: COX15/CtaA family protein [Zeimonas sp.]
MIRWLAIVACALTVCITASSAFLRHSQAGLGCPGGPNCERSIDAGAQAPAPGIGAARALHRVSAMLVGVLVLLVAVFGWPSMRTGARAVLAFALADTAFLAWLGRLTPHPLPLVTIGTLVGGIALAAAFAWIAASLRPMSPAAGRSPTTPALVALALLGAAAWIGTMIGAHDAIGACEGARCAGSLRLDADALDPLRAAHALDAAGARGLHWLHRAVAAAFAIAALLVAARARRSEAGLAAVLLLALLVAQIATGIGTTIGSRPLTTATLHNAFATLLAVMLAAIAARSLSGRLRARSATATGSG